MGVVGREVASKPHNLRFLSGIRAAPAVAAALLVVACGSSPAPVAPTPPTPPTPPPSPMVAIVSIDGLRPDALSPERTPNILDLASRGTACWQAETIRPTNTLPSHASMLTGFPPSVHGLTWGDYQPARGLCRVPTIFSHARAAGLRTAMIVGKEKLGHLNLTGSLDSFELVGGGDGSVVNHAVVQIQAGADLLLVHLPDVDVSGHATGWMSPPYLQQVGEADQAVGRFLKAMPPHGTVILTADHGGMGINHAMERAQDLGIPWVIMGPEVVENQVLARRVSTMDTAATALHVLGLQLPKDASGTPVAEAFRPGTRAARRALR